MASTDDSSEKKIYTLAEVQELAADKEKCIMVISNHIYDVTKFMDEVSWARRWRGETPFFSLC